MANPILNQLEEDILSWILGFLTWKEILNARVNRKWREAAKLTRVPNSYVHWRGLRIPQLYIRNKKFGDALEWISRALPRIQTINVDFSLVATEFFEFAEGEQTNKSSSSNMNTSTKGPDRSELVLKPPPINLRSLVNFYDLRHLKLKEARLNGSYSFLSQFRNLRTLDLLGNGKLKWDLKMLAGLPKLEELYCLRNYSLSGNLKSVRVLRSKLVKLILPYCEEVEGLLKDLADFPLLEELDVVGTQVIGELNELGSTDFVSMKKLKIGKGLYGGARLSLIDDCANGHW